MQRLAYSYVRFSTIKQERGDSERRQIESARKYASEHGYVLDESLGVDRGKSAYTGKNISEGQLGEFIKRIRAKQIPKGSILIVESPDRVSRQPFAEALANLSTHPECWGRGSFHFHPRSAAARRTHLCRYIANRH